MWLVGDRYFPSLLEAQTYSRELLLHWQAEEVEPQWIAPGRPPGHERLEYGGRGIYDGKTIKMGRMAKMWPSEFGIDMSGVFYLPGIPTIDDCLKWLRGDRSVGYTPSLSRTS